MWWPTPADKTPRFFHPCPGNNPYNLEPGMYGLVDVASGSEAWYRPFRNASGDAKADPIRIATANELSAPTVDSIQFNTSAAPTVSEGSVYWNENEYTIDIVTGLGAVIQVGHEQLILFYNDTGSIIPNGAAVRPKAATVVGGYIVPTPELARANSHETCEGTISFATHEIAIGAVGLMTRFGRVRGLDTSSFSPGDDLWLSATVAGEVTNVKPEFPDFSISVGGALNSDASDGEMFVSVTRDVFNIFNDTHDGSFMETIKFLVTSDGATVTGTLTNSADSGRDLTMIFSDGLTTLDTTPGATIELTAGSDTAPQRNFVYLRLSSKTLTKSTSGWPLTEHIKVADLFIQSAASVQTEGARVNRNWNDHIKSEGDNGHLLHIAERLRREHAQWDSGMEGVTTVVASAVDFSVTGGFAYQLHRQSFPALDTATGDPVYFVNEFTTPYYKTTDIEDVTDDASGDSLNNTSYSIVYWVVQNRTGEACHIMANMPSGTYSRITPQNAVDDADNKSVYAFPEEFRGKGVLIARCTYVNTSGTITLYDTEDLRGTIPNATAGGGAGGTGVTTFLGLSDTDSTYSGHAGKVPAVNVGETALEFTELSTNSTLDGNGTSTDFGIHTNLALGESLVFPQADHVDSTDRWALTNRAATVLIDGQTIVGDGIGDSGRLAADSRYIFVSALSDSIYKFDRHTLRMIEVSAAVAGDRAIVRTDNKLVSVLSSAVEFNPEDLSDYEIVTATGADSVRAAFYRPSDGLIYAINMTSKQYMSLTRGASTYTVTNIRVLSELADDAKSACLTFDDDGFYVADFFNTTTDEIYVRKFNMAGVEQYATSAITLGASGDATVMCTGATKVTLRTGSRTYIFEDTGAALVEKHTSSDIIGGGYDVYSEGIVGHVAREAGELTLQSMQLPSLTQVIPDFYSSLDGEGVESSPSVVNANGYKEVITKAERIKSVLAYSSNAPRRPGGRTASAAASTIELSDEGNIIVADNSANLINFTPDADVLASERFIFTVWPTTAYATYAVQVYVDGGEVDVLQLKQTIPTEATVPGLRLFKFVIMDGVVRSYDGTAEYVAGG